MPLLLTILNSFYIWTALVITATNANHNTFVRVKAKLQGREENLAGLSNTTKPLSV